MNGSGKMKALTKQREDIKMLDNPTNQTLDPMNSGQTDTLGTADDVVTEPQKSWCLPTLERALLTVIGFFAYYLAFHMGRTFVEWQLGLTIVLSVVTAIVIPALLRENERVTSELKGKQLCACFVCSIGIFIIIGLDLILILVVLLSGKTGYKFVAGLGAVLIIFFPILYLENDRVSSQLSEEVTEPRNLMHALIFIVLAVMVGSVGWIVGTGTRTFIEVAVPKLTLL